MRTLFVVDDDPDDLELFNEAARLADCSAECVVCGDPLLARQMLETMQPPDVIFVDINMPMYTGFELLKDLRAETRLSNIPIAMLSTAMDTMASATLKSMGAQYTLVKPDSFDRYVRMLEAILADI